MTTNSALNPVCFLYHPFYRSGIWQWLHWALSSGSLTGSLLNIQFAEALLPSCCDYWQNSAIRAVEQNLSILCWLLAGSQSQFYFIVSFFLFVFVCFLATWASVAHQASLKCMNREGNRDSLPARPQSVSYDFILLIKACHFFFFCVLFKIILFCIFWLF